jgi:tetratricopeptide (TPR) repeat protein
MSSNNENNREPFDFESFDNFYEQFVKGVNFEEVFSKENLKQAYEEYKKTKTGITDKAILVDKLTDLINKKDKITLEKEVMDQSYKIHSMNAPDLFRVNVIACLLVDNYKLAIASLEKINRNYDNADELRAIIHYNIKEYNRASKIFEKIHTPSKTSTSLLMKAISDWHTGAKDIYKHKIELEPLVQKSANTNTFLGTIFFNRGKYQEAQEYFVDAVLLSNHSEHARLNSLRTLYQLDKLSAENNFSKFLYETHSTLTAEQLISEMNKKELGIPHFKIKDLHTLAERLL